MLAWSFVFVRASIVGIRWYLAMVFTCTYVVMNDVEENLFLGF